MRGLFRGGMAVSTEDVKGARRAAMKLVLAQFAATLIIALSFSLGSSAHAGASALVGGGIGVVGSLAMVMIVFWPAGGADPKRVLRGFYRGEAVKLGLTVVLFVAVLRTGSVDALPMLTAYIGTMFAYWVALLKSGKV
jgi:ATP synthase protein I